MRTALSVLRRVFLRAAWSLSAAVIAVAAVVPAMSAEPPSWQRIVVPKVDEAARRFADPPPEYSLTMWWFWNGAMTEEAIRRDLAELKARGIGSVMLWPYNGLVDLEYLSPAWFDRVKFAVAEARRAGVRVWLMDEGCYPSGFVGGNVTRKRPQQRMQILVPVKNDRGEVEVRPDFRTPATRYIHMPDFRKDGTYSLFDALDAKATGDFLHDVHEEYRKRFGDEFGRTVLGFMGDEPSFPGVPYTPGIFEEFQRRKGYDVRPHLAGFFAPSPTDENRRIRADYWDVWTDRYRDAYFRPQAEWCSRHGLEFMIHLCGEEDMRTLLALNGDYFKCMQPVQIPGVDAIWRQIWPDKVADYPKLASSAAHLGGRPRAFCEGYAVYGRGITVEQAKWVLDHLLARGINLFQAMSYLSSRDTFRPYFCPPDLNLSPQWPHYSLLWAYANRMSYLLAVGEPTAQIAVYYPTTSGWLGDFSANAAALSVAQQLLERQRDFDFIDEDSLQHGLKREGNALVNRSGQHYRAVLVPPLAVITQSALDRLEQFARGGGTVVFLGRLPQRVAGRTYRDAAPGPKSLRWAALAADLAAQPLLSAETLALLPPPDVVVRQGWGGDPAPSIKYVHRRLADGDVYFLFHEGFQTLDLSLTLRGEGVAQCWDAVTGRRQRVAATAEGNALRMRIPFAPREAKTIVLGPAIGAPKEAFTAMKPTPNRITLGGDWQVTLAGRSYHGPLKSWADLGHADYSGTARYVKEFKFAADDKHAGRHWRLDLGEVRYSAQVWLNGKDLGTRAWGPFSWPLGDALQPGTNRLEIELANTAANELAANPARRKELEAKGWLRNSYIRTYLPFDEEMIPSGLLGPVSLVEYTPSQ